MRQKITVYVRTVKVPVDGVLVQEPYTVKEGYGAYEISKHTTFQTKLKKKYTYVLPDKQKAIVEVAK